MIVARDILVIGLGIPVERLTNKGTMKSQHYRQVKECFRRLRRDAATAHRESEKLLSENRFNALRDSIALLQREVSDLDRALLMAELNKIPSWDL